MREDVLCAADLPVSLPIGGTVCQVAMVLPAKEWADRLGIAWDTVRQRRYRGDPWTEAFQPYLRRTPFNSPSAIPVRQRKQLKINGALQMKKLEVSIPAVAHVIVTGVSEGAQAAVMKRFQEVLQQEFGAAVSMALPAALPAEDADDVRKALWLVSSA
ncbi:hypothetical protein LLE81_00205 [Staphylococcus epidermidis]|nr:hypothetical protein [Staphylococcus epidermidis]